MKRHTFWDYLITGGIIVIGLAEIAHLTAVFLGRPFSWCAMLFWGLVGVVLAAVVIYGLAGKRFWKRGNHVKIAKTAGQADRARKVLYVLFAAVVLSQLLFLWTDGSGYRQGDMTVETVESFLAQNQVYGVNPMTGFPYEGGIPTRLKILCLPTLYGSICRLTGLSSRLVVWKVAPTVTLFGCYAAFAALGRCLFGDNGKKRGLFLVLVSLLLWAGTYMYGVDGFGVLCGGWQGVSIRGGVLLPWLLSLCLRKKWLSAVLCVLAEACIVWTLYGLGACLALAVGMAAARFVCDRIQTDSAQGGKEAIK